MMSRLCIISCANFNQEITASVGAEGWDDVISIAFPARCGRPPITWDELRPLLPDGCEQLVIVGSTCLKGLCDPPPDFPFTRIVSLEQCFHLVAGQHFVDGLIKSGAYLVTPEWLADWREQLRQMGFMPEQAHDFFQEVARELVLLDTGLDSESSRRAAELGATVGLTARCYPVGLDYTRLFLNRLVLEWRIEKERATVRERERRHAGELADHVSAMDLLARLARTHTEAEAITAIKEMFCMLFAPAALYYLRVEHTVPLHGDSIPDDIIDALRELHNDYAWSPDGQGFLLRICYGDELLGLVAVDRLAFSEFRERYLNLALSVTGVCGLAIDNSRNRKRLMEAEKMASLGTLVAGVAHEINTPLGVVLAASTTMHERSSLLARSFSERTMTQSDLDRYFELAGSSTSLILKNMERIAHLTETFRQVAVEGKTPEKLMFRLRECIEDVIRSMGERLAAERITVNIVCDPGLEINSLVDDWVTIFSNLISNSLKHGFRGREQGVIDISVTHSNNELQLVYRDDGNGITPESLTRVFDPFFTTDLQLGMGLGMHLIYNIITQRLGGHIRCESRPGQGVSFYIEVPK